jgi:hypothetical protein
MLFGLSGVAMMFIGLITSDITYTKFFIISGDYLHLLCGLPFSFVIAGLGKKYRKSIFILIMMILGGVIL